MSGNSAPGQEEPHGGCLLLRELEGHDITVGSGLVVVGAGGLPLFSRTFLAHFPESPVLEISCGAGGNARTLPGQTQKEENWGRPLQIAKTNSVELAPGVQAHVTNGKRGGRLPDNKVPLGDPSIGPSC